MSSGIGSSGRRLLMSLGRVLGIEDVKQAPQRLKTDELVPVVSLDPGQAGAGQAQLIASLPLVGLSIVGWQAIGFPDTLSSPGIVGGNPFYRNNQDEEIVILGYRVQVQFPAPPAPPPGTSWLRLTELRQTATSAVSMVRLSTFAAGLYVDGIQWDYYFSYPMWKATSIIGDDPPRPMTESVMGASPIYVPAGSRWGLELQWWNNDFTALQAFPAGTTMNCELFLMSSPKGMRPPGI